MSKLRGQYLAVPWTIYVVGFVVGVPALILAIILTSVYDLTRWILYLVRKRKGEVQPKFLSTPAQLLQRLKRKLGEVNGDGDQPHDIPLDDFGETRSIT